MRSKLLPLMMALMMVLAVLAGCAQTPVAQTPAPEAPADDVEAPADDVEAPADDVEAPADDAESPADETPAAAIDMSQTQEIELSGWESDVSWGTDVEIDKLGQYIMDKFNITITSKNTGWGDYHEKYSLWAASNDLPATVSIDIIGGTTYYQWINEGVVRAIPDDLSLFPTLEYNLSLGESTAYQVDGKNWMLPRMTYADPAWWCMDRGILYRKDWLENLNLEVPTNEQEFIDMCVAFQTQDPDGNGVNDTIGFSSASSYGFIWSQGFANYGQVQGNWVINSDGSASLTSASDAAFNIAFMLREMNKKGGFDPDLLTYASDDDIINKFAAGLVGAFMNQISPTHTNKMYRRWTPINPDKPFTECVGILPLWQEEGVEPVAFGEKAYWSETYFGNKVTDEEIVRYLALYDWWSSEEGCIFMGFGIEGEDYEYDENGNLVSLLPMKEDGTVMTVAEKYPNVYCCWLAVWTDDLNQYKNPNIPPEVLEMCTAERDRRMAEWQAANIDWKVQAIVTDEKNECTAYPAGDYMQIVLDLSDKSNEDWRAELEAKWDTLGYTAACESIAAAYADMNK